MHNKPKNARRLNTKMNMIVSIQCSFVVINWFPRSRFTRSVYGRKRSRYDRILPKYMWSYYDRISTWSYTEQHDRIQRKTEIVYGLRVLRQWTTVFFSVYRRMSPYTTRRYTIVIRSHVNRRISPYTVAYDRACSTWVTAAELRIVESVLDRIEYMEVKVSRFLYKTCFVFILF